MDSWAHDSFRVERNLSGVNILLTGGTGFIGKRLVPVLLKRGCSLRLLVRNLAKAKEIAVAGVELFQGDLETPACFPAALHDVDAVIHLAGLVAAWRRADLDRINAQATYRLARAAADFRGGPPRFLYVSSQAAMGPNPPGRTRIESDLPSPASEYGRSKRNGEIAIEDIGPSLPWTILRPSAVYGPGDVALLPFFRMAAKGTVLLPSRPQMRFSLIHVDDLCEGIAAALESPRCVARSYFLTGEEQPSVREVLDMMGQAFGKKPRVIPIPGGVVWPMALIADAVAWLRRRPGFFSCDKLAEMRAAEWLCSAQRAQEDAGFRQRIPLADGLRQTAAWYKSQGWIQ